MGAIASYQTVTLSSWMQFFIMYLLFLAGSYLVHYFCCTVTDVGTLISEIVAASAEQSDGIDQVNCAVISMDQLTQQNAALAEETSVASVSMSEETRRLSENRKTYYGKAISARFSDQIR